MKEGFIPFFSQKNVLKTGWKTIGKLDFLGNQTPQNRKGEENQREWLRCVSLSTAQEARFGFLNEGSP